MALLSGKLHNPLMTEAELFEFGKALEASWSEWVDCVDLLGVEPRHPWRLRIHPSAFIKFPKRKLKRPINYFA